MYGVPHDKLQKLWKEKVNRVNSQSSKLSSWPWTLMNQRSGPKPYLYTDLRMVANALWEGLDRWKKVNWKCRGKPIWSTDIWQDIATRVEKLIVRVCHVDAHVPKNQANEEHRNKEQADRVAQVKVSQVDLDWQHKGLDDLEGLFQPS
ncbi:hypothetical protein BTVI_37794 [Pitangus sulphuratus]|nr:hypothetical protein BTVI_37794 [Pitangus sulphuratus]